jgi:hypothetical protein
VSGARPRAVLVEEDASDELLSRGDAELLVEVLDVVLDTVTLFEQLGLRTIPGPRFRARLLASRGQMLIPKAGDDMLPGRSRTELAWPDPTRRRRRARRARPANEPREREA